MFNIEDDVQGRLRRFLDNNLKLYAHSFLVGFCCQLYKTREEKYLLDLQRVQGPQFLFLDLCAAFLAQLRVL